MPRYVYECESAGCPTGGHFDVFQSIREDCLESCPHCGARAGRVIMPVGLAAPTGDLALKEKGFAKLVKRDRGVYENVTALDRESRYYYADRPDTMPDLKRRITD